MTKRYLYILVTTVGLIILYGVFAIVAYTQSLQSGAVTHKAIGRIQVITVNSVPAWGFQTDRSLAHPLKQKFRFADLPSARQHDGQRVVIEYQIQDVIGGDWGIVIQLLNIEEIK